MDAVGAPEMGSLELGYREFLPHAQAVVEGLVKMGWYNIFCVCHHQGEYGQEALCMKLVAANLSLEVPNASRPHFWGELPPAEQPRAPSIQVLTAQAGSTLEPEFNHVGHGNFYETAAILGLFPDAVDLSELASGRDDLPWFGETQHADGSDINAGKSSKDATEEFGTALVDAWAASLAAEVLTRSGQEPPPTDELKRGYAQPQPGRRTHCPGARQLDQMRPAEIQDAAKRGVPVLLPIGVLENHGTPRSSYPQLGTTPLLTRSCGQAITSRLASTSYARAASASSPRRRPKLSWLRLCPTARAWRRSVRLPWAASSWATRSTCRTCRPCCAASSRCEPPQPLGSIRICPWLPESAPGIYQNLRMS